MKAGGRVSLVGFGSFSVSKRDARTGRNPQTGKEIQIAAKNVVRFKAGSELSDAVKESLDFKEFLLEKLCPLSRTIGKGRSFSLLNKITTSIN